MTELRTNEHTNIRTDERKGENYIPVGINAGGIIRYSLPITLYKKYDILLGYNFGMFTFDTLFISDILYRSESHLHEVPIYVKTCIVTS